MNRPATIPMALSADNRARSAVRFADPAFRAMYAIRFFGNIEYRPAEAFLEKDKPKPATKPTYNPYSRTDRGRLPPPMPEAAARPPEPQAPSRDVEDATLVLVHLGCNKKEAAGMVGAALAAGKRTTDEIFRFALDQRGRR